VLEQVLSTPAARCHHCFGVGDATSPRNPRWPIVRSP